MKLTKLFNHYMILKWKSQPIESGIVAHAYLGEHVQAIATRTGCEILTQLPVQKKINAVDWGIKPFVGCAVFSDDKRTIGPYLSPTRTISQRSNVKFTFLPDLCSLSPVCNDTNPRSRNLAVRKRHFGVEKKNSPNSLVFGISTTKHAA